MANRAFIDKQYTLIKKVVELYAAVSVGAAGAVTLQKWNYPTLGSTAAPASTYTAALTTTPAGGGYPLQYQTGSEGVRTVTRTAAGLWTIKLQDSYVRVLQVTAQGSLAGGLSAIVGAALNSTVTSMTAAGGSTIGLALLSATGTALDPANGEQILLRILMHDATEI